MSEQIESDRKMLRNKTQGASQESTSYIPRLIKPVPKLNTRLRIHSLSTINILYYVDESFTMGDKYVLKKLDLIRTELEKRADLFEAAATFLQKSVVRSSLHYWIPGFKINNIFSFIKVVLPEFAKHYKAHFAEYSITGRIPMNCLPFIKEHFAEAAGMLAIMQEDLRRFESCISLPYWSETEPCTISQETYAYVSAPPTLEISSDIKGILVPELSFVEVSIDGQVIVATLAQFDGLISKREAFKQFWFGKNIIDTEWNLMPCDDKGEL